MLDFGHGRRDRSRTATRAFSTGSFHDSIPTASRFLYPQDDQRNVDPLKPIVWSSVEGATMHSSLERNDPRGR